MKTSPVNRSDGPLTVGDLARCSITMTLSVRPSFRRRVHRREHDGVSISAMAGAPGQGASQCGVDLLRREPPGQVAACRSVRLARLRRYSRHVSQMITMSKTVKSARPSDGA